MNAIHMIKQNDSDPPFLCTPLDRSAQPLRTLPVGTTARFRMKHSKDAAKVDALATLFTETDDAGLFYRVRYDWNTLAGDTNTPGSYRAEVELFWPGGGSETFPNGGYATVIVTAELG